jgi:hypothetical protein
MRRRRIRRGRLSAVLTAVVAAVGAVAMMFLATPAQADTSGGRIAQPIPVRPHQPPKRRRAGNLLRLPALVRKCWGTRTRT